MMEESDARGNNKFVQIKKEAPIGCLQKPLFASFFSALYEHLFHSKASVASVGYRSRAVRIPGFAVITCGIAFSARMQTME